jgi:UrcA family protein
MNNQLPRICTSRTAKTRSGGLYLLCLAVIAPVTAIADPHLAGKPEAISATVSVANLDLTTPAGISAAHQRLAATTWRLCHAFFDSRRVDNDAALVDCYRETLANASRRLEAQLKAASVASTAVARNTP